MNLDLVSLPGVDVIADVEARGLPFRSNTFDRVIAFNLLEHVSDLVHVMQEIHRVLTPHGVIHIRVPHFTHRGAYGDPTHRRFFSYDTFFYFWSEFRWNYHFGFGFSKVRVRLIFAKGRQLHNHVVEPLMNHLPVVYELTFLRSLFPAHQVEVFLEK